MCELTGVSRSGFYNWIRSAASRYNKELQDKSDFSLILEAYNYRGYAKGARGIYMRLRHKGIRMNLKKIRRLIVIRQIKCGLLPQIKNNFLRYAEALQSVLFATISAHCFM